MKPMITAVAFLASALAVSAQTLDADADGMVTFEELLAVVPTTTQESFAEADVDGDGMINADELAAARDKGLIPADG